MTTTDPTPTMSEPGADSTDQLWRWSATEMAQAVAGGAGLQSRGRGELPGADRRGQPAAQCSGGGAARRGTVPG